MKPEFKIALPIAICTLLLMIGMFTKGWAGASERGGSFSSGLRSAEMCFDGGGDRGGCESRSYSDIHDRSPRDEDTLAIMWSGRVTLFFSTLLLGFSIWSIVRIALQRKGPQLALVCTFAGLCIVIGAIFILVSLGVFRRMDAKAGFSGPLFILSCIGLIISTAIAKGQIRRLAAALPAGELPRGQLPPGAYPPPPSGPGGYPPPHGQFGGPGAPPHGGPFGGPGPGGYPPPPNQFGGPGGPPPGGPGGYPPPPNQFGGPGGPPPGGPGGYPPPPGQFGGPGGPPPGGPGGPGGYPTPPGGPGGYPTPPGSPVGYPTPPGGPGGYTSPPGPFGGPGGPPPGASNPYSTPAPGASNPYGAPPPGNFASTPPPSAFCPRDGAPARWIPEQNRFHCDRCNQPV